MGRPCSFSRPVGPIPSDGRSVNFSRSESFTHLAITTWHFPVLWSHSHAIANHFPIGHPSFHYFSSSTLNSGVLLGCAPEKGKSTLVTYVAKSILLAFSHIPTRDVTCAYPLLVYGWNLTLNQNRCDRLLVLTWYTRVRFDLNLSVIDCGFIDHDL